MTRQVSLLEDAKLTVLNDGSGILVLLLASDVMTLSVDPTTLRRDALGYFSTE